MLGELDRPLSVGPSAQLGPSVFAVPQPDLGSAELDLLQALQIRVTQQEARLLALEAWQAQEAARWIVRLRAWVTRWLARGR